MERSLRSPFQWLRTEASDDTFVGQGNADLESGKGLGDKLGHTVGTQGAGFVMVRVWVPACVCAC